MLWKSLNCLLFLFIVWGDAKLFITIDGAPKQSQPPIIYIVQPYDPNYWFAPYYGPYIDEPMVTFQTESNCTGGQRDVIIGLEDAQIGSVIIVSVLANEISMSTPFGFFGAFYLQYDGDDTNGTASNFPGGLLNSPGIGSNVSATIPESDGSFIDFTSFGRALGINLVCASDHFVNITLSAIDNGNQFTELTFTSNNGSVYENYFFRFDNLNWSNPSFDWTSVGAFQVKFEMRNISIDVNLETVSILGYEVSGSVFADVTRDSTPDSMMPGIELNLYNGLNGNGSIIDTTTSDSNGDFVFFPQADGNYTVCLADGNLTVCAINVFLLH